VNQSFVDQLTNPDNLYWAWIKVRKQYDRESVWYDEIELAEFEANLEEGLRSIAVQFKNGNYRMVPLVPLPRPKKKKDKEHEIRQYFWISVRDQVAWAALVNIIGPNLDSKMPTWSYGNRLYRPVWFEHEGNKKIKKIDWYRHTTGRIYRKFPHSWPLFRRHIYLTIGEMTRQKGYRDPQDEEEYQSQSTLPEDLRLPYLRKDYWRRTFGELHWCAIDFEKFYPSINLDVIVENLNRFLDGFVFDESQVRRLISGMLDFPLNLKGWSGEDLEAMQLSKDMPCCRGIPTGLFVGHFLANLAMLGIDKEVDRRIEHGRRIAHFRYVDDHVFLAPSFGELIDWVREYRNVLRNSNIDVVVNAEKTNPEELRDPLDQYLKSDGSYCLDDFKECTRLDPKFPKPLMTETVCQVSNVARATIEILNQEEREHILDELRHLMLADFNDDEMREDTRLSFAASRLSRIAFTVLRMADLKRHFKTDISEMKGELESFQGLHEASDDLQHKEKRAIERRLELAQKRLDHISRNAPSAEKYSREHILNLLMKAIHEYPDKLQLWRSALEFCRVNGIEKLDVIEVEIRQLVKGKELTCCYLCSFIKQILARHIVDCARAIVDRDKGYWKRLAAHRYLEAVLKYCSKGCHERCGVVHRGKRKFHELLSNDLLRCSLGTAEVVLKPHSTSTSRVSSETRDDISDLLARIRATKCSRIKWTSPSDYWRKHRYHSIASWAWWAEGRTRDSWQSTAGPVWSAVAEELSASDRSSLAFWLRYPQNIGKVVLSKMKGCTSAVKYFEHSNTGWLYDVANASPKLRRHLEPFIKENKLKLRIVRSEGMSDRVSLHEWVARTNEMEGHDPRSSEWTCLAILEKCIERMGTPRDIGNAYEVDDLALIHPANFHLPATWTQEISGTRTWELWKNEFERDEIILSERGAFVGDSRLTPYWDSSLEIDYNFIQVRAYGMILMGLLRKSFDWPNLWNPMGLQRAWDLLSRKLIGEIHCSSRTKGILYASMLSRPRESFYFANELFTQPKVDQKDTLTVLPLICSPDHMRDHLCAARDVLRRYQMSVYNNMPRQLIPIRLQAVENSQWYLGSTE
jgi:hypothetical protein